MNEAISRYPAIANSQNLRIAAETALYAARAQNPNAPIEDLLATFHTGIVELAGVKQTEIRDGRAAAAGAIPVIPANTGTPGMQERPKATRHSLRDGSFERDAAAMWDHFVGRPGG